jgi:hypothetical protein
MHCMNFTVLGMKPELIKDRLYYHQSGLLAMLMYALMRWTVPRSLCVDNLNTRLSNSVSCRTKIRAVSTSRTHPWHSLMSR